jgi:hypothetical protein
MRVGADAAELSAVRLAFDALIDVLALSILGEQAIADFVRAGLTDAAHFTGFVVVAG